MSAAVAPVAAKPAAKKASKPAEHPKFSVMIITAISTLKDRAGSSLPAITKVILYALLRASFAELDPPRD